MTVSVATPGRLGMDTSSYVVMFVVTVIMPLSVFVVLRCLLLYISRLKPETMFALRPCAA